MIVIDGNIGVGKSTVLDGLTHHGYLVQKESIEKWPLDEFYADPKTWAMPMQLAVFWSMRRGGEFPHMVRERCPDSAYWVFWRASEHPVDEDFAVTDFYDRHRWTPDVHIYLKASPEWCFRNVQKRTQAGDSGVTLEYIKELHDRYEKFFYGRKHVEINAEQPPEDILSDIIRCLRR
jgi:deoxyadenosine/deoxycytidine kinase